jgi:hypothetical protein
MSNVLIRDIPPEDLERIRSAAAERGDSLQGYLRDALHAQAAYLRRQDALARTRRRLRGRSPVPDEAREAAIDAADSAHAARADRLSGSRE